MSTLAHQSWQMTSGSGTVVAYLRPECGQLENDPAQISFAKRNDLGPPGT